MLFQIIEKGFLMLPLMQTGGSPPPTLSTPGAGFFFGGLGVQNTVMAAALAWNPSAQNQLRFCQFVLPIGIIVRNVSIQNTAVGSAGSKVVVGIYDAGKNLLINSGEFDGTLNTVQTKTLGTPVTLPAGVYYFVWTVLGTGFASITSAGSAQINTFTGSGAFGNVATPRTGTAANAYSSPNMPASLGTLTAVVFGTIPLGFFEP